MVLLEARINFYEAPDFSLSLPPFHSGKVSQVIVLMNSLPRIA
jgi:hypothetical protein